MLKTLTSTVAKMKGLIMKLKGVGEGEGGGRRAQVDLLEVVERAVSPLAGKGVRVVGEHVDSHLDADEIQTVVLNLVLNALEACQGNGSVLVEVGGGETPYFTVTDNGCGMPQDYLANELFEPFRTTKRKGLGVGLYQCRQIVASHGGRIQVMSKVGVGSKFTVLLPNDIGGLNQNAIPFPHT
jgi:signal transduction histidine kinase